MTSDKYSLEKAFEYLKKAFEYLKKAGYGPTHEGWRIVTIPIWKQCWVSVTTEYVLMHLVGSGYTADELHRLLDMVDDISVACANFDYRVTSIPVLADGEIRFPDDFEN